jgi:hypothetical protein
MPREQPEPKETKPQDIVNLGFTCASAYAACLWPFIRCRFGSHAFAGYILSAIGMVVYGAYRNSPLMSWYLIAWVIAVAYRRVTADGNQHSRYQGYAFVFGWMASQHVARLAETFIAFGLAVFFAINEDEAMSDFFMYMIPALLVVMWVEKAVDQAWKRQRHDAEVMARHMSEL